MPARPQPSLFDDEPPPASAATDAAAGLVLVAAGSAALNKAQQTFNRLIGKIGQQRAALEAWTTYLARYQQRVAQELAPVRGDLRATQRQMVVLLDAHLAQTAKGLRLAKGLRRKAVYLIETLVAAVLQDGPDAEMEAIHDRHGDVSISDLRDAELALTEQLLGSMLGEDAVQGHGADSAAALFAHAQQKLQADAQARAEATQAHAESAQAKRQAGAAGGKAAQAQARKDQAAKEASQSVREVYRRLASALHPDRAADPAEQTRRTALMQRVNQAYDAGDLLALLALQIETEQINTVDLAHITDARLAHYNRVLREQAAELDAELNSLLDPLRQMLDLPNRQVLVLPAMVDAALTQAIRQTRRTLRELQSDLQVFADPARLRAALKTLTLDDGAGDADNFDGLAMLMEMAQGFEQQAGGGAAGKPAGRRRR